MKIAKYRAGLCVSILIQTLPLAVVGANEPPLKLPSLPIECVLTFDEDNQGVREVQEPIGAVRELDEETGRVIYRITPEEHQLLERAKRAEREQERQWEFRQKAHDVRYRRSMTQRDYNCGFSYLASDCGDQWVYFGSRDRDLEMDKDLLGTIWIQRVSLGWRKNRPANDEDKPHRSVWIQHRQSHLYPQGYATHELNEGPESFSGTYAGWGTNLAAQLDSSDFSQAEKSVAISCELGQLDFDRDGNLFSVGACFQGRATSLELSDFEDYGVTSNVAELAPGAVMRFVRYREGQEREGRHQPDRRLSTEIDLRFLRTQDTDETILDLELRADLNPHLACVVRLTNDNIETGVEAHDLYEDHQLYLGFDVTP